jgi:hypothetical protein
MVVTDSSQCFAQLPVLSLRYAKENSILLHNCKQYFCHAAQSDDGSVDVQEDKQSNPYRKLL